MWKRSNGNGRSHEKVCPFCETTFVRASRVKVEGTTGNECPGCGKILYYRQVNSHKEAIPIEDKLAMDRIFGLIAAQNGFDAESSAREKKFAYDLIDKVKRFLGSEPLDVGLTPQEFAESMIDFVLSNPDMANQWFGWDFRLPSLLYIANHKTRLMRHYHDYLVRENQVYEPKEQQLKSKLDILKEQFDDTQQPIWA